MAGNRAGARGQSLGFSGCPGLPTAAEALWKGDSSLGKVTGSASGLLLLTASSW